MDLVFFIDLYPRTPTLLHLKSRSEDNPKIHVADYFRHCHVSRWLCKLKLTSIVRIKSLSHSIIILEFVSRTKICWENRLIGDNGRAAKVTVDGTDFETVEYNPFNPGRRSHKFNHAGLRYEVAISIAKCYIVHINGPFICGAWPDIRIARTCLHEMLEPNEYYLADSGYRCGRGPAITRDKLPPHRRSTFDRLMARHEIINRRFKEFAILGSRFRHEEEKHGDVFRCVAVLVQFDLAEGHVPFDVM